MMKCFTVLVLLTVFTVTISLERVTNAICQDGNCGKRFIGVISYSSSSFIVSKPCAMDESSKINFNVTFRKDDNSSVVLTSTDGFLNLSLTCEQYLCSIIVDTEFNAIIKIRMLWGLPITVILPIEKLGTEYLFSAYENISSYYIILAINNATLVYLHNSNNLLLSINGMPWFNSSLVDNGLRLMELDYMDFIMCAYLEDESTRYYSRIVSNNNIAVFGYFATLSGKPDERMGFQLKSVGMLGQRYIVYYPQLDNPVKSVTNNVIKIVATQNRTEVTLSSDQSVMLAQAESVNFVIQPHEHMFIFADKPIMVFLLFSDTTEIPLPLMAEEQYSTEYLLELPDRKTILLLVLPRGAENNVNLQGSTILSYNFSNIGHNMISAILVTDPTNAVIAKLSSDQKFGGISFTTTEDGAWVIITSIECGFRIINKECMLKVCNTSDCDESDLTCESPANPPIIQETHARSNEGIVIGMTVVSTGIIIAASLLAANYLKKHNKNRVRSQQ